MRRNALLVVLAVTVGVTIEATPQSAWAATNWIVHVGTTGKGEAHAQALPGGPGGVTAACNAPTTSKTIKVTWNGVTHAVSYTVFQSTTSASSGYSSVASGVTTTSWTSSTLTAGTNYWYEVATIIGSHWTSANSSASGESTINAANPFCVQP